MRLLNTQINDLGKLEYVFSGEDGFPFEYPDKQGLIDAGYTDEEIQDVMAVVVNVPYNQINFYFFNGNTHVTIN